jgi:hypothetical protein
MDARRHQELDGRWALRRESGLLPPLRVLHKRIDGRRGSTRLGRLVRLPFRVEDGPAGPELVYAGPLRVVRDRLEPDGNGGWAGQAHVFGVRVGRFRMMPDRPHR